MKKMFKTTIHLIAGEPIVMIVDASRVGEEIGKVFMDVTETVIKVDVKEPQKTFWIAKDKITFILHEELS